MKKNYLCVPAMMLSMIMLIICSCKDEQKKNDYDWSNPVNVVESIGQEVSDNHDKWTRKNWDAASDNLENALRNLPKPMADDEITVVNTAISRMTIYGERHKRKAKNLLTVIENFKKTDVAVSDVLNVPGDAVAGLLKGFVIQEGGYTNIRKGPGVNYEEATQIKDGSPIYYTVYNDKWRVVYDNNGTALGYIHASKVIPASSSMGQIPESSAGNTPSPDYVMLNLKGKVKSFRILGEVPYWDVIGTGVEFDRNGRIVKAEGSKVRMDRDKQGRIVKYVFDKIWDPDEPGRGSCTYTYNSKGQVTNIKILTPYDEWNNGFERDKNGDIVKWLAFSSVDPVIKFNYVYQEYDQHGNWTKCVIEGVPITRILTYWE